MPQINQKGMWLRQPVDGKVRAAWFIPAAAALVSCVLLLLTLCGLTGFKELYNLWVPLAVGAGLCAVFGVLKKLRRQNLFYLGTLFALVVVILLFGSRILEGICLFWNRLGDVWTAGTGRVLPKLETRYTARQQEICLLLFSMLLGGICALFCCFAAERRLSALAVLLSALLLAGMLVFCRDRSFPYLIPALLTAVLLLLLSGWERKSVKWQAAVGWIGAMAVAAALVMAACLPEVAAWSSAYSGKLLRSIHTRRYETEYTTLPEGDLADSSQNDEVVNPALVVTMEKPEQMYLRGFTGAAFKDNTWSAADPAVLADHKEVLYWLNLQEFNPSAQFEAAVSYAEVEKNVVTVQNIGACSRYLYVPFSLCDGSYLRANDLNTDFVTSDGNRIYVFTAVTGGTQLIAPALEHLQTSEDESVLRYRKAESAYRGYVREHYLQIPPEVLEKMAGHWDSTAAGYGAAETLTSQQAQACVLEFLAKCFPSDGTKREMALPLFAAEDSDYQYATVAALTLRYFGIPSRYAEGYIITEEMAAEAGRGGSITVDSSCAAAWVEIYQDGVGWIPMSLAQGAGEGTEGSGPDRNPAQNGDEKTEPEEGRELEETPDRPVEEPQPNGGYRTAVQKVILYLAALLLPAALLLVLLLVLRRKLLLRCRNRRFDAPDKNDAVAWIFADTAVLLEKLGFDRGNGSMQRLHGPIRLELGEEYAARFGEMVKLNARAMFSSRVMDETHRNAAAAFHDATLQQIKTRKKWYQKLWLQWILCLY